MEDLEPLALHLLGLQNREQGKHLEGFEAKALEKLQSYQWMGNVRELRNVIENAVIHAEGKRLTADDLVLRRRSKEPDFGTLLDQPFREARLEFDRYYFNRLLEREKVKTRAADLAGIDRSVLDDHLKKLEGK